MPGFCVKHAFDGPDPDFAGGGFKFFPDRILHMFHSSVQASAMFLFSISRIACTFGVELPSLNSSAIHSPAIFFASSCPITRSPMHSTLLLLLKTERSAE